MNGFSERFLEQRSRVLAGDRDRRAAWNDHGFRDFSTFDVPRTDNAIDFAAQTFVYFCVDEGMFNGFEDPLAILDVFLLAEGFRHAHTPVVMAERADALRNTRPLNIGRARDYFQDSYLPPR
jgi:hypothetical protein